MRQLVCIFCNNGARHYLKRIRQELKAFNRRNSLTWTQIVDLFSLLRSSAAADPATPEQSSCFAEARANQSYKILGCFVPDHFSKVVQVLAMTAYFKILQFRALHARHSGQTMLYVKLNYNLAQYYFKFHENILKTSEIPKILSKNNSRLNFLSYC